MAPTREKADKLLNDMLAAPFNADANDFLYQWDSSRDYDASPGLEKIQAVLLAINSADDERNPPETGLMTEALKRVKNGKLYLIPASEDTRGHGTTGMAKFWKQQLQELLQTRAEADDVGGSSLTSKFVMAGHSRSKNGVALLAMTPGIHVLLPAKTWMPGRGRA